MPPKRFRCVILRWNLFLCQTIHGAFQAPQHFLAILCVFNSDWVLADIRDLVELRPGKVGNGEKGKEGVWMEEHVVFNNGFAGQCLHNGKVGDAKHGVTPLCNLDAADGSAALCVVSERIVQIERVKVVVTSHTVVPDQAHVTLVFVAKLGAGGPSETGLVLKDTKGSKEGQDSGSTNRVESVQDRGSTAVLKHKGRSEEFRHWPSNNSEHGETSVTEFTFLHVVQIERVAETTRIKADITGVRTIQVGRPIKERKSFGVRQTVEAATTVATLL